MSNSEKAAALAKILIPYLKRPTAAALAAPRHEPEPIHNMAEADLPTRVTREKGAAVALSQRFVGSTAAQLFNEKIPGAPPGAAFDD